MQRTDKHNATPQGKRAARALLLAALLLAARPALAAAGAVLQKGSPDSVGVSPGRLASALTRMAELVDADAMAGAVVLVARNGVIVAEQTFGLADVENSIPFRTDTICAMASVTKPVTATAVMILAGQGKLNIDDPVEKYLPAFGSQQLVVDGRPRGHRAITLRQLLTHTSGLPQDVPSRKLPYMDRGWLSRTLPSIADEAAKMDLRFEPGTRYSYSSAGVAVLGRIVEVVSGRPFDAFQKARLFGPLGMTDSSFQPPASAAGRVAVLYADRDGKRVAYYRFDPAFPITNPAPNGGLFSTARDMAAFVQMYLNRGEYNGVQVLGSGEVRLMLSDQTPQLPQMRGLGWQLQPFVQRLPHLPGSAVFAHSGASGTFLWGDPQRGVAGVFFPQTSGRRVNEAHKEFFERINAAIDPPDTRIDPQWARHVIASGYPTSTAVAADFTGDGRVDVIVNGEGKTRLYVAPEWKEVIINAGPIDAIHSAVMDVDGDGNPDYIGARYSPGLVFWLERPANPLAGPWPYHLVDDKVDGIHGLAVGDIDGDGRPDLAGTSAQPTGPFANSLAWFKIPHNPRRAARWERHILARGDAPGLAHYVGLGDVNGDGRLDAATGAKLAKGGNYFAWWEAPKDPAQAWTKHVISAAEEGATNILIADVNGDGRMDFVASRGHGKGLVWFEAPDWKPHVIDSGITGPHSLAVGDVNGDGHIDVVTCAKHDFTVAWYENDGKGNFKMHPIYRDQAAYDVRLVDMNGDGAPDILVAGQESRNVVWYENKTRNRR